MNINYNTIDEYILLQPPDLRSSLEQMRGIIKKAVPDAIEVISYKMPAFKLHGIVVWFALNKAHVGLYARPNVLEKFRIQLASYKTTKSAIHFPFNRKFPEQLIADIVCYAAYLNLDKKDRIK